MGMMGGCLGGLGLFGMAATLILGVGVIALIAYAIVRGTGRGAPVASPGSTADRALAVLRERFARGEIDRTEYQERRGTLLDESPSL